jgi:hypothetical protein
MNRPARSLDHVVYSQARARAQHSQELPVQARLVRDVHRRVLAPDRIEAGISKRKPERVGSDKLDTIGEARPVAQHVSHTAVLGGQVDPGHLHAMTRREIAGRSAKPTTHIQHTLADCEPGELRQLLRCLPTADVKFVDRGEIVRAELVGIQACAA